MWGARAAVRLGCALSQKVLMQNGTRCSLPQQIVSMHPFQDAAAEIPSGFICPIERDVMSDPVSTADGHTYERAAIQKWLEARDTSPKTGLVLEHKRLTPNFSLRSVICEWRSTGDHRSRKRKRCEENSAADDLRRFLAAIGLEDAEEALVSYGVTTESRFWRLAESDVRELTQHSLRPLSRRLLSEALARHQALTTELEDTRRHLSLESLVRVLNDRVCSRYLQRRACSAILDCALRLEASELPRLLESGAVEAVVAAFKRADSREQHGWQLSDDATAQARAVWCACHADHREDESRRVAGKQERSDRRREHGPGRRRRRRRRGRGGGSSPSEGEVLCGVMARLCGGAEGEPRERTLLESAMGHSEALLAAVGSEETRATAAQGLTALWGLARVYGAAVLRRGEGGEEAVVRVVRGHTESAEVQRRGLALLAEVAEGWGRAPEPLVFAAMEAAVSAMAVHPADPGLLVEACRALGGLVSATGAWRTVVDVKAVEAVARATREHREKAEVVAAGMEAMEAVARAEAGTCRLVGDGVDAVLECMGSCREEEPPLAAACRVVRRVAEGGGLGAAQAAKAFAVLERGLARWAGEGGREERWEHIAMEEMECLLAVGVRDGGRCRVSRATVETVARCMTVASGSSGLKAAGLRLLLRLARRDELELHASLAETVLGATFAAVSEPWDMTDGELAEACGLWNLLCGDAGQRAAARELGLVQALLAAMRAFPQSAAVQQAALRGLAQLARDGEGGTGAVAAGGVETVVAALGVRSGDARADVELLAMGLHVLAMMGKQEELAACDSSQCCAAVKAVLRAMEECAASQRVQISACDVLSRLDKAVVAKEESARRCLELVLAALRNHRRRPRVLAKACTALGGLAVSDEWDGAIVAAGGVCAVLAAMERHRQAPEVMQRGMFALQNLACCAAGRKALADADGVHRATACAMPFLSDFCLARDWMDMFASCAEKLSAAAASVRVAAPALVRVLRTSEVSSNTAAACRLLELQCTDTEAAHQIVAHEGVEALVACLRANDDKELVVVAACAALKRLAASKDGVGKCVVEIEAQAELTALLAAFPQEDSSVHDAVKSLQDTLRESER